MLGLLVDSASESVMYATAAVVAGRLAWHEYNAGSGNVDVQSWAITYGWHVRSTARALVREGYCLESESRRAATALVKLVHEAAE